MTEVGKTNPGSTAVMMAGTERRISCEKVEAGHTIGNATLQTEHQNSELKSELTDPKKPSYGLQ